MAPPTREGGLLAWQYRNYPNGHRDRRNLALHAATWPLFLLGTCALVLSPFLGPRLLAFAVPALIVPLAVQGLGHGFEPNRPSPFLGPWDYLSRLFVEQWITFPRYLLGGGFARAWRAAGGVPAQAPR